VKATDRHNVKSVIIV